METQTAQSQPGPTVRDKFVTAQQYFDRGLIHYVMGERPQAIAWYRRALELRSDDALGHYLLGLALRAAGQDREAEEEWRRVMASPQAGSKADWARWKTEELLHHEELLHQMEV